MMGRASDHLGNMTPVGEYNVWVDPEAAKVVFASGMALKMVGLDVSRKHASFTPDEAAELRDVGLPSGEVLRRHPEGSQRSVGCRHLCREFELPDPIAMAVAIDPAVSTRTERRFVAVETGGEWHRGQTIVDYHEITIAGGYEPNVELVEEASRERFPYCCTKPCERRAGRKPRIRILPPRRQSKTDFGELCQGDVRRMILAGTW
jgi:purine nucleosidase